MEEENGSVVDAGTPGEAGKDAQGGSAPAQRPRKKWLRVPLYLLAFVGALSIGAIVYTASRQPAPADTAEAAVERPTADEAAVIDSVMTGSYGKYSEAKRGWLYVADDDRTYVMRVIQQVKMTDGAAGDEMYIMASGAATDGATETKLGAFHVLPDPDKPGTLVWIGTADLYGGVNAVRPEDVQFTALSDKLWGWIVKMQDGTDPGDHVAMDHVVFAPHDNSIAELARFPAAFDYDIGAAECAANSERQKALMAKIKADEAKAPASAAATPAAAEPAAAERQDTQTAEGEDESVEEDPVTDAEDFRLCQKRRWTYRVGPAKSSIPAPISVTAGGTLDGKPVPAKTWKLMFDSKAFRYNVPPDLSAE